MQNDLFENFISEHCDLAESLWERAEGRDFSYRIGEIAFTLRIMVRNLANLHCPAIEHALCSKNENDEWTIYAVDASESDFPLPPEEWILPTNNTDHQRRLHGSPTDDFVLNADELNGIWNLLDRRKKRALYWIRDARNLVEWEAGGPFRLILHWISQNHDYQMLHGAAVDFGTAKILLTGVGGSGKSTTTAAAVHEGYKIAGEDFVIVNKIGDPKAHALYDTLKLTGMALELFPDYAAKAVNPDRPTDEKARIYLSEVSPGCLISRMPLEAIAVLRLGRKKNTDIRPVSPAIALRALAPSTLFLLRNGFNEGFRWIADFVRTVPCYEVILGTDPLEAVGKLSKCEVKSDHRCYANT